LYGLESTYKERELEKFARRSAYENLEWRCKAVRDTISSKTECIPGDDEIATGMRGIPAMDAKAKQDFINWQRIMRLDAVRINADWIQLSPSQANISKAVADQLAMEVGLRDDGMLEPSLLHHAGRLVSILEVYALYDPEIGYCQGMSDLLSPLVAHLDEDYEAFWCFASFMHTARRNFRTDEEGIKHQLQTISQIVKHSDPQLYKHFERIKATDCCFVYRMVVVLMRRELSYGQTLLLWESLWADRTALRMDNKAKISCMRVHSKASATSGLLLYVIAAAIRQKRRAIMDNCSCMEEVLEECNGMAGNLNIGVLLNDAHNLIASIGRKVSVC
jgi:hypothetical protein